MKLVEMQEKYPKAEPEVYKNKLAKDLNIKTYSCTCGSTHSRKHDAEMHWWVKHFDKENYVK